MKAGEILFVVEVGNLARGGKTYYSEVVKVGRKYFYLTNQRHEIKFYLDGWQQATKYCKNYSIYETEAAYLEVQAAYRLMKLLRSSFDPWNSRHFTLDQLKCAVKALGIED